jgi:hypothetical protein
LEDWTTRLSKQGHAAKVNPQLGGERPVVFFTLTPDGITKHPESTLTFACQADGTVVCKSKVMAGSETSLQAGDPGAAEAWAKDRLSQFVAAVLKASLRK